MTRRRDLSQRILDLVIASALMLITAPLWPLAFLAVRVESRGPALFRGRRIGRGAQEFTIFKFRSMRHDPTASGTAVTVGGDPRITLTGRILRISKLDELPQLFNVLRGEMSVVGWRPEDPRYLHHYDDSMREIFRYRPGMTGPASIEFRHEESILAGRGGDPEEVYVSELLPAKVAIDLDYCRQATWRTDLAMLSRTIRAVASRHR